MVAWAHDTQNPLCSLGAYRHLKNKDGCKQQHALHQAKEAKKQEELKQKQMAFFRPKAAARDSPESDAGPSEAQPSKGATLGNQGARATHSVLRETAKAAHFQQARGSRPSSSKPLTTPRCSTTATPRQTAKLRDIPPTRDQDTRYTDQI